MTNETTGMTGGSSPSLSLGDGEGPAGETRSLAS